MTALLAFLLVLTVVGLAFCGFYAFQLRTRAAHLDADLVAQRTRHDEDVKQLNDYSANAKAKYQGLVNKYNEVAKRWNESSTELKAEIQRLSKWKNVADADVRAVEIVRSARRRWRRPRPMRTTYSPPRNKTLAPCRRRQTRK